ncbi:MAG: hypothetical protein H0W44_02620 [Gammaproteobacteria bacterium]|nr:hypothetical protein [Gammaproteobacteria bacterium]
MKKVILALFAILMSATALAGKTYQVTGPVLELTDKKIVVENRDKEKWEIERNAATKVTGDLKVGAKVTIQYSMSAVSAEVK